MLEFFKIANKGSTGKHQHRSDTLHVITEQAACISLMCFLVSMSYERECSPLP